MQSDGIFYTYYNKIKPIGYTDSDWAVDIEKQKKDLRDIYLILA